MSDETRKELDRALDGVPAGGTVEVARPGGRAAIDVVEADRLGVKVRRVGVTREHPIAVDAEARRLAEGMRALPERLEPVEIAPELGGAVLRTRPEELRRREFFEVGITPGSTTVTRQRVTDDGRAPADFTLTRDQLDGLLDELG